MEDIKKTKLVIENGPSFSGFSPVWQGAENFGEIVFTTGMTGYVESLTDPSFARQILTFTYPLIGNYGVPEKSAWESQKIHAAGVVMSELAPHNSHALAANSLGAWLKEQGIPFIFGIDTRALTKALRQSGVAPGAIVDYEKKPRTFPRINEENLVAKSSIQKPIAYGTGKKRIIAIDCGMKENIMRHLTRFSWQVIRVPYNYDFTGEKYDGVFISNGPGDPKLCVETVSHLKKALAKKVPVFGICLGAQLLALAAEAKTYKLRFGHRGQNQPVVATDTKRCFLTSQNHGYAILEKSLPKEWEVTFRNLNDDTVSGIRHRKLPFSAVQFHPEANPGPIDTEWLFDAFYQEVR